MILKDCILHIPLAIAYSFLKITLWQQKFAYCILQIEYWILNIAYCIFYIAYCILHISKHIHLMQANISNSSPHISFGSIQTWKMQNPTNLVYIFVNMCKRCNFACKFLCNSHKKVCGSKIYPIKGWTIKNLSKWNFVFAIS